MFPFPYAAAGSAANATQGAAYALANNPALKSQLETQAGILDTLSLRACDTVQRLSELNMGLARELVDDGIATCRQVLACDNPAQVAATALRQLQPSGERLFRYGRALVDAIAEAQAGLPAAMAQQGRRAVAG